MEVLGGSGVGIMDLNDALISNGIPPRDPVAGALWIDTSTGTSVLKVYINNKWETQKLDVSKLDPDLATKLQGVIDTLGTIANDGVLTFSDRVTLSKELGEILGTLPSKSTGNVYPSALPDYTVLDASGSGTFANMRLRATDVGIGTDTAWYKDVETAYKALNSFLSTFTPKPWDITTANKAINVVIATPDVFRQRFLDYYMAELRLATETEKQAKKKAEEYAEKLTDGSSVVDKTEILSGNPVYTDKSDDAVVHVGVDGKSEQVVVEGNPNLLGNKYDEWTTLDMSANSYFGEYQEGVELVVGQTYTFSVIVEKLSSDTFPIDINIGNGVGKTYLWDFPTWRLTSIPMGERISITHTILPTDVTADRKHFSWRIYTNLKAMKIRFKEAKLEKGTTATPIPAPSPDYPSVINSLDKSFDIVSSVGGRNLWTDNSRLERVSSRFLYFSTHEILAGYIGKNITVSFDIKINDTGTVRDLSIYAYQESGITIGSGKTITPSKEWQRLYFSTEVISKSVPSGLTLGGMAFYDHIGDNNYTVKNFKIEEGITDGLFNLSPEETPLNIVTNQTYKTNILLSEPLRSVGDVKDRLFLDADGLWKVERNVGEVVLVGTERVDHSDRTTHKYFMVHVPNLNSKNVYTNKSSHYSINSNPYSVNKDNTFWVYSDSSQSNVRIQMDSFLNPSDFSNWLKKQVTLDNPVTVQYELSTPTIETLSAEQQTKLNNIQSFKGSNYVYTMDNVVPNLNAKFKSNAWYRNFAIQRDLTEVNDVAESLKNFTDTAFADGIIERAEAKAIAEHLNTLKKENDDLSNQYNGIYANTSLIGAFKTNLYNSKVAYNTAYSNLTTAVNTAIAGNKTTPAQKTDVDTKFTAYSGALKLLTQRMNEALTAISGKQATDASAVVKAELDTLSTATTALKNLTDSAFIDNVVQVAEAQAISEHLNTVKKENDDLSNQYNGIYANVLLIGTPKTNLLSAKTAYNTAYNNLIASVNSAIAGNKTTVAQKTDVDTKFTAYSGALKLLTQRLYESLTAISGKQATDATDAVQVGVKNYFTKTHTFTQTTSNGQFEPRSPEAPNGFKVVGNSSSNGQVRLNNVITENGWWTVSFDIRGSQSLAVGMTVDICDLGSTRVMTNTTNTYTRVSVSVKVTNYSSTLYNFVDFGAIAYAYFWVDNIKVEKGNKASDYSEAPEDIQEDINKKTGAPVRYIRDWLNSSTANNGNHWVALQARALDGTDRARGILPTSDLALTSPTVLTNGSTATSPYVSGVTTGIQYIQVDLGKVYYDISDIRVWHYYADGRAYNNTKTEISVDGSNWEPLYDSLTQGTYPETAEGNILPTTVVDRLRIITSRVALAEQVITPEAITGTVMSQETFVEWKENVDTKANGEDVDNLMLEMGNVQDTLNGTDTTEGIITKMSTVEQKADSWTADISELKEVTGVQGSVTEKVTAYMEFKMTGLEIGKSDSDMKVNISNSQIDFMDKGVSVAYINGQKMFITQVEITESLIIGNHKIEKLDGNSDITIVSWVGQGG